MKKVTRFEKKTTSCIPKRKLRVAAYCRVSTESDAQLDSLDAQKAHYEQFISSHSDWELAGIYFDAGISGTKKENRLELLRLMSDCEDGKIDYILTKSISRLARNTTDCLELVRKLKSLNIPVYFEKENLNTNTMDGELLLTLMGSMAEGESVSISENNKWSVVRRFKSGTYKLTNPPYGYVWDGKNLVVNEDEAKHVRWIFAQVLAGVPLTRIAREMNNMGLRTRRGNIWQQESLRGLIANERYVGDVLFQKTYTDCHFKRHSNQGEVNQYILTDHHVALVSREDFDAATAMIEQHRREKNIETESEKYLRRYPLSSKIVCGICGKTFKRRAQNGYTAWWCGGHIQDKTACSMKYIREDSIEKAFILMLNKLTFGFKQILLPYYASLKASFELSKDESTSENLEALQQSFSENKGKQDILVRLASQGLIDETLLIHERSLLVAEARIIQKQMQVSLHDHTKNDEVLLASQELIRLAEKRMSFSSFDEKLFARHVDHILVERRDTIIFVLKCGLELREKLETVNGRRISQCMGTESKTESRK